MKIIGIDPGITGGIAVLTQCIDCDVLAVHEIPAVAGEVNTAEVLRRRHAARIVVVPGLRQRRAEAAGMKIIGIDPGITGGIAVLTQCIDCDVLAVHEIPAVAGEVNTAEVLRLIRDEKPDMAIIETASSRPHQGVSSTFKFGAAYGALQACVVACGIPLHRVTPAAWKKHYKLNSDKERSRALAIRMWPNMREFALKKAHGVAEAALIARYGAEVLR